ncbi:glycine cleavage system protein R [Pseudohaliea rubra]|uniref:Glycine cleavage system transcriptional repressor n=1 Tax=Pseudohaliea rubra DSM 19751 TaxID=1265313 RepID=A0A095VPP4_9GAMM|nr:ACT domain-containing protein [Pseudohaliea rubra]KGE03447.1 Glycine cleavage system regulatory protein [Pseudohaliea rubra DSM 19751]
MQKAIVVSFIAEDRPGIVERLAAVVAEHGGNWEDARLSQLGGKFAGLALVNLPIAAEAALRDAIAGLAEEAIDCTVTDAGEMPAQQGELLTLALVGPDRPGIIHEVTRALRGAGLNLSRLESTVKSAPMSAEPLFHATLEARAPAATDRTTLEQELDRIAEAMGLEIDLLQRD